MFGQLSGYGETGHARYADIAVSLAVKSVVDMLKLWVHKGPGQRIILPTITKAKFDTLQWSPKLLNAISVRHV